MRGLMLVLIAFQIMVGSRMVFEAIDRNTAAIEAASRGRR